MTTDRPSHACYQLDMLFNCSVADCHDDILLTISVGCAAATGWYPGSWRRTGSHPIWGGEGETHQGKLQFELLWVYMLILFIYLF